MREKKSYRKQTIIFMAVLAGTVVVGILSWRSTAFSDWYTNDVFPYVSAPLSRFTSLFPFSIGEWMLWAAVLWLVIVAIAVIRDLLYCLWRKYRSWRNAGKGTGTVAAERKPADSFKNVNLKSKRLLKVTVRIAITVFAVMTLNCVVLYHTSSLEQQLRGYGREYSIEELGNLRDEVVDQCNRLSMLVPRDAEGEVIYAGGYGAMGQKAREAIRNEAAIDGDDIPFLLRLSGWSVTPKPLLASGFVSQQYMQGYYFPFSMEANYNTVMKVMNVPFTMCHEISHTHGFIYEDEANLIGFLACIHSDDPVFQYSGWLGVLNYVDNSFYDNVDISVYRTHPAISDTVRSDNEFLSEESWKEVEEKAVVSTETAKAATDVYLDSTLKANGVESGKASYSHVVGLLLMYFDNQ